MKIRCTRCNIPHSDHPQANKNGGIGRYFEWKHGFCGVCQDRQREYERKARPHLLDRRLKKHLSSNVNQTLTEYQNA